MHVNKAYLDHCIACAPACDLRSVHALCLIDGAILGALNVHTEHLYRMAHHADVAVIQQISLMGAQP